MEKEVDNELKKERYRAEVVQALDSVVKMVMCAFDGVSLEGHPLNSYQKMRYVHGSIREFKRILKDNIKNKVVLQ